MIVAEQIPVSAEFASSFSIEGEVTARDLSVACLFLHQAAVLGEAGDVMLRDNGTRHALALTRRDRIHVEEARWRRLRDCRIAGLPAPTLKFGRRPDGSEYPWRHNADDRFPVMIDPDLIDLWTGDGGVVYLPLRLLQLAESRFSIIILMKAMTWAQGDFPRKSLVRRKGPSITLRFGLEELAGMIGSKNAWNRRLVDQYLIPAAEEISELTDWQITIRPVVAHTGRIRAVDIVIVDPVEDPALDERMIEVTGRDSIRKVKRPAMQKMAASASPVTVSKVALDNAVPLSRLSPDRQ